MTDKEVVVVGSWRGRRLRVNKQEDKIQAGEMKWHSLRWGSGWGRSSLSMI